MPPPTARAPTDLDGRPLYPVDIADLDPAKAFAAGLRLPVRVVEGGVTGSPTALRLLDTEHRLVAEIHAGIGLSPLSPVGARGIATAIAKAINAVGTAA